MRKIVLGFYSIILFLSLFSFTAKVGAQEDLGDISFQPNMIPETSITFDNSRFVFDWLDNHFEIALFTCGEDFEFELEIEEDKTKLKVKINGTEWEREVESGVVVDKFDSNVTWGINIWDIPEEIADNVEYLVWKIEDASFGIGEIEVEEIEVFEEGYNITRLHLPDNLVLSYEDLWLYNFTVSHPNKHETIVKGVKGKTVWNLDPITYSSPTIVVVGTYTNLMWELWNASNTNGWNVVHQQGYDNYLINNTIVDIGDGSITTTCSDVSVNILFETNQNKGFRIRNHATLTFGEVYDADNHLTENGVSYIFNQSISAWMIRCESGGGAFYLYDSKLSSIGYEVAGYRFGKIQTYSSSNRVWNCLLDGLMLENGAGILWDIYNVKLTNALYGTGTRFSGSIDLFWISHVARGTQIYTTTSATFENCDFRNCSDFTFFCREITVDSYMINTFSDDWNFDFYLTCTGEVYRQYEFDLTFTFNNGSYAEGTNVTISNSYLGTSDSWILTSNGSIPEQTYSMGHYNQTGGNTIYDYNPYNITATLDGYQTYSQLLNVTQKEDLTIALQPKTGFTTGFGTGFIIALMIGLIFVLAGIAVKTKKGN